MNNSMIVEQIQRLKDEAKKSMDAYAKELKAYRHDYGFSYSDYYVHRLRMEEYYRGSWNALNELEQQLMR